MKKHQLRKKQHRVKGFARQGKGHGWAVGGPSVRQLLKKELDYMVAEAKW
jgi:hypothetical protein